MEQELIQNMFASIGGLAAAVVAITEFLKQKINTSGWQTIVVSFISSIFLSIVGYTFALGIFVGVEWHIIIIYSIAATLMANGLSTWPVIKSVLELIKIKK